MPKKQQIYNDIIGLLEKLAANDENKKEINEDILEKFNKITLVQDLECKDGSRENNLEYIKKIVKYAKYLDFNIIAKIYSYSCKYGRIEILKTIKQEREDIKDINSYGRFGKNNYDGFVFACTDGQYETVKWLIESFGNDMFAGDNYYGYQMACRYEHFKIVELLIENCADKDKMNKSRYYFGYREAYRVCDTSKESRTGEPENVFDLLKKTFSHDEDMIKSNKFSEITTYADVEKYMRK